MIGKNITTQRANVIDDMTNPEQVVNGFAWTSKDEHVAWFSQSTDTGIKANSRISMETGTQIRNIRVIRNNRIRHLMFGRSASNLASIVLAHGTERDALCERTNEAR